MHLPAGLTCWQLFYWWCQVWSDFIFILFNVFLCTLSSLFTVLKLLKDVLPAREGALLLFFVCPFFFLTSVWWAWVSWHLLCAAKFWFKNTNNYNIRKMPKEYSYSLDDNRAKVWWVNVSNVFVTVSQSCNGTDMTALSWAIPAHFLYWW